MANGPQISARVSRQNHQTDPRSKIGSVRPDVKPWVDKAICCIGPYLGQLSEPDKELLFRTMRNNSRRIDQWQRIGHFNSLDALKAKLQDWKDRGL
jgi:hypothetical protein